jgi:Fe-S cluster biosynthesis and repair protein YggX
MMKNQSYCNKKYQIEIHFCWNSWTSKQEMMKNQPHRNMKFLSEIWFLLKFMNNQARNDEEPTTQEHDIS